MILESTIEEPLEATGTETAPASSSSTHPPRRILLVDDDTDLRQIFAQLLTTLGYQVDTAEDGEAGWQAIHAESFTPDNYDLLITDNNMPRLSGTGLIKRVRSAGLNLPVILASGNPPADTEPLRLSALLPKPFTTDELVRTVKRVLHTTARQPFQP